MGIDSFVRLAENAVRLAKEETGDGRHATVDASDLKKYASVMQ